MIAQRGAILATALGVLASCSKSRLPIESSSSARPAVSDAAAPPGSVSPSASISLSASQASDGGPDSWVTFDHTADPTDLGPSGPRWSFRTPKLPALSDDGGRVLLGNSAQEFSAPFSVGVMRVADSKVISSTPLLRQNELETAMRTADSGAAALTALAVQVDERVARANRDFATQKWTPLIRCTVDNPNDVQPPCSMAEQRIQCNGLLAVYRKGQFVIDAGSQHATIRAPIGSVHAVRNPNNGGSIPVHACFDGVWLTPSRRLLVGSLLQECGGAGGDWCVVPSEWHAVTLPFAPLETPLAASTADRGASCPAGMTRVAGGSFEMGSVDGLLDERPPRHRDVGTFCMDALEVTVRDFVACVKARRCFAPSTGTFCNGSGDAAHPVNCVTWQQADSYCRWMSKRLPSEVEWEYAARGSEGRVFPWGNAEPGPDVCWRRAWNAGSCPVGAHGGDRSPFGALDMAGNVEEWTASPAGKGIVGSAHVIRGGDWSEDHASELRGARRREMPDSAQGDRLGFRCAK